VACAQIGAGATASGDAALPLDASIAPVSASHPSADAAAALDACSIVYSRPGFSGGFGVGIVSGMGEITPGRDATRYAAIGNAPELQTDQPLWVITTSGTIYLPLAGEMTDATCVVAQGDWLRPLWFATGPVRGSSGTLITPMPQPQAVMRLPALAP
jgi:hypothetical protein